MTNQDPDQLWKKVIPAIMRSVKKGDWIHVAVLARHGRDMAETFDDEFGYLLMEFARQKAVEMLDREAVDA